MAAYGYVYDRRKWDAKRQSSTARLVETVFPRPFYCLSVKRRTYRQLVNQKSFCVYLQLSVLLKPCARLGEYHSAM